MFFGHVNAPATFIRLMRRVLRNSQSTNNYLDDVLVYTPDWTRHLAALRHFLSVSGKLIPPSDRPNVKLEKS